MVATLLTLEAGRFERAQKVFPLHAFPPVGIFVYIFIHIVKGNIYFYMLKCRMEAAPNARTPADV